jgi:hypothetical protein
MTSGHIALSFEGAAEDSHMGQPDFRMGGKILFLALVDKGDDAHTAKRIDGRRSNRRITNCLETTSRAKREERKPPAIVSAADHN